MGSAECAEGLNNNTNDNNNNSNTNNDNDNDEGEDPHGDAHDYDDDKDDNDDWYIIFHILIRRPLWGSKACRSFSVSMM